MKNIYISLLLLVFTGCCFGQKNLRLLSNYTVTPGITYAGVWHWDDSLGNEYALLGTSHGLTIVDITNPSGPVHVFDVPDTAGEWREVKVWSHYAYVSNEGQYGHGGGGITIVDLSTLPTPIYKKYTGDSSIAGQLSTAHTVEIADGYLYINGPRSINGQYLKNGGTIICSLTDPWNPAYVGAYTLNYVHDCFVRGDTLITSEIYANIGCGNRYGFSIINASDKTNTDNNVLATSPTPSCYNHDTWMSDDDHYLYTTDELPKSPLGSFDISNLGFIQKVDLYLTSKNPVGEVHNVRVLNDFLINACYGDTSHTGSQVTLVDGSDPTNLIEVGNYQMCAPDTGLMIGWDVDPFLPDSNILATEGKHGLFIFAPTYIRACHLQGSVTDSITNFAINSAEIALISSSKDSIYDSLTTAYTGNYKTGLADSGTFNIRFSKAGYITKTINNVTLTNGGVVTLNVKLWNGITGIRETGTSSDLFRAFPNPTNGDVTVNIDQSLLINDHLHVLVIDALGKIVRDITDIHEPVINLRRQGIANGSYNLQLIDDTKKIAEATIVFQ